MQMKWIPPRTITQTAYATRCFFCTGAVLITTESSHYKETKDDELHRAWNKAVSRDAIVFDIASTQHRKRRV